MWVRIKYGGNDGYASDHSVFICDTDEDIKTLPTDKTVNELVEDKRTCSIGSTAIVSHTENKYFLNSLSQWELKGDGIGSVVGTNNTATVDEFKEYFNI